MGDNLSSLSTRELDLLDVRLERGLNSVQSRKVIMFAISFYFTNL